MMRASSSTAEVPERRHKNRLRGQPAWLLGQNAEGDVSCGDKLARAYLDGELMLDELISRRIRLDEVNDGFAALKRGETIRSVITFD